MQIQEDINILVPYITKIWTNKDWSMAMNYFDYLSFDKGVIVVLGTTRESDFIKSLLEFLTLSGNVEVTEELGTERMTDYLVVVPDKYVDKRFVMHSRTEVEQFQKADYIIGIVQVDILEMKIADAVISAEDFATYNDVNMQDLICPPVLSKVIKEHEKYDYLYIDGVSDEGKRYHARELARFHKSGTCVRMINTDTAYVESLIRPKS